MLPTLVYPATRLLPQQTRLIHASEGLRLRVVSGRLWLTQPNVAQDLFLVPGDCIDLKQDWVVIGADAEPRVECGAPVLCSAYELQPLADHAVTRGIVLGFLVRALRFPLRVGRFLRLVPAPPSAS